MTPNQLEAIRAVFCCICATLTRSQHIMRTRSADSSRLSHPVQWDTISAILTNVYHIYQLKGYFCVHRPYSDEASQASLSQVAQYLNESKTLKKKWIKTKIFISVIKSIPKKSILCNIRYGINQFLHWDEQIGTNGFVLTQHAVSNFGVSFIWHPRPD